MAVTCSSTVSLFTHPHLWYIGADRWHKNGPLLWKRVSMTNAFAASNDETTARRRLGTRGANGLWRIAQCAAIRPSSHLWQAPSVAPRAEPVQTASFTVSKPVGCVARRSEKNDISYSLLEEKGRLGTKAEQICPDASVTRRQLSAVISWTVYVLHVISGCTQQTCHHTGGARQLKWQIVRQDVRIFTRSTSVDEAFSVTFLPAVLLARRKFGCRDEKLRCTQSVNLSHSDGHEPPGGNGESRSICNFVGLSVCLSVPVYQPRFGCTRASTSREDRQSTGRLFCEWLLLEQRTVHRASVGLRMAWGAMLQSW